MTVYNYFLPIKFEMVVERFSFNTEINLHGQNQKQDFLSYIDKHKSGESSLKPLSVLEEQYQSMPSVLL